MTDSFVGNLLVASTLVDDPVFSRAVCLIVHQDQDNVIGVMLNRPMQPLPPEMMQMLGGDGEHENRLPEEEKVLAGATESMGTVHFGGPNSGPVVAVHGCSQHAESEAGLGVYVAAQKQHLEALVREHTSPYRLIVGHVGWEIDDLIEQLEGGLWHLIPATSDAVLDCEDEEMWPRLVRRATAGSMARWLATPDVARAHVWN